MKHSEQNKKYVWMTKFMSVGEWIMDHSKIVMPLVLIVCVIITIIVAVNANKREALEKEAEQAAMAVAAGDAENSLDGEIPDVALEENAHPEINDMVRTYYNAQAEGDINTVTALNAYLNEIEIIRVQELSKYIDSYPELNVYTKPGPEENTYVAYVYSEVLFTDADVALPGLQTYYVEINGEDGNFINGGTYDDKIYDYIKKVTLQDDVVDLNNRVAVEYNEMLAEDEDLNEFIAYLREKINEEVGEKLAEAEAPETEEENAAASEEGETADAAAEQTVLRTVRATDVVNIRSSDSETADKLDKAEVGQEFTLVEQRENGWSKVRYKDRDAFIKSEYLELVSEEIVDAELAENNVPAPTQKPEKAENTSETSTSKDTVTGTVEVIESVKIRKSASTDSESLGTAFGGEILEVIMKQADGWTRIKYKGQVAYVKSEYVE
ncbi:MAG: SH3 domain-containing protein [Clostridium sp.]|nr:SH3 domain-containing protein [Clostridium sp.]